MTESLGSQDIYDGNKREMFDHLVNEAIFTATDRVIISLYSSDLMQIQKIVNIALKYDKELRLLVEKPKGLLI